MKESLLFRSVLMWWPQPELKAVVLFVTSEPVPFQPWLNQGRQGAAGQGVHRVHLRLCAAHSDGMEFM